MDPDPYAEGGYPGGQAPAADDAPTDPFMRAPLNVAPPPGVRPGGRNIRHLDMVVPRVYLEPDEALDRLRTRAFRWAIARDVVVVAVGLYLLGSWILPALWRGLGG